MPFLLMPLLVDCCVIDDVVAVAVTFAVAVAVAIAFTAVALDVFVDTLFHF